MKHFVGGELMIKHHLTREQFKEKLAAILALYDEPTKSMCIVIIKFTDGERHLTPSWSVETKHDNVVRYVDVHCQANTPPIEVGYSVIQDLIDFCPPS